MSGPRYTRTLFWPCGQLEAAHARWPSVFAPPTESYHRILERQCSADARAGVGLVLLVPGTVNGLAEYVARVDGDLTDDGDTLHGYLVELVEAGMIVTWPPGRNDPCWCGSSVKYKRCCGRPG